MPKVSVIIPVYNVERYLYKCLESITTQTMNDIEIIVLNDGSPDNSEDIILEFCKKDKRIKYFKHENIGLGLTRNKGINVAEGDYIAFIDSDDYITNDMIEKLYNNAIHNNSDVVCGQTFIQEGDTFFIRNKFNVPEVIKIDGENYERFFKQFYFSRIYTHNAWDKLYKKSFIIDNGIIFGDNKIIFAEDNYFQFQILNSGPIVSFVSVPVYYYMIRDGSIMRSYKENLVTRNIEMIKFFYSVKSMNEGAKQKVIDLLLFDIMIIESNNIVCSKKKFSDLRKSFRKLYDSEIFPKIVSSVRKNRSYCLEPNWSRRHAIRFIFQLYKLKLGYLVERSIYLRQKFVGA